MGPVADDRDTVIAALQEQLAQAAVVTEQLQQFVVEREGVVVDASRRLQHADREGEALQGMLESTMLMLDQDASSLVRVFFSFVCSFLSLFLSFFFLFFFFLSLFLTFFVCLFLF